MILAKYHEYVFNIKKREFVGNFDEMYKDEDRFNFDSWHQEDSRQLARLICVDILSFYNFQSILDIGSGKGAFTHLLKKRNNEVLALDISENALSKLESRYPDIETRVMNFNEIDTVEELLTSRKFDLAFTSETLSYIENYEALISLISKYVKHFLINLFIPDNPIGFIKSKDELLDTFSKYFEIDHVVDVMSEKKIVIFGSTRN